LTIWFGASYIKGKEVIVMAEVEVKDKPEETKPVDKKSEPAAPPKKRPQQTFLDECAG